MLPEPYEFPVNAYVRRHGPTGLPYNDYKDWVRDEFQFRCVYCLHRERWVKDGWRDFQIDHVVPQSLDPSRVDAYSNLVYSCPLCNQTKGSRLLPDPCHVAYRDLLRFEVDGSVEAVGPRGIECIEFLGLDAPHLKRFRQSKFRIYQRLMELIDLVDGDFDELDEEGVLDDLMDLLGYPLELPHLHKKRHKLTTKPGSEKDCYAARLMRDELRPVY